MKDEIPFFGWVPYLSKMKKPLFTLLFLPLFIFGCTSTLPEITTVNSSNLPIEKDVPWPDLQTAWRHLDFKDAKLIRLTPDYGQFQSGLRSLKEGDLASATEYFSEIAISSPDTFICRNSLDLLAGLLFHQQNWETYLSLPKDSLSDQDNWNLALAFHSFPSEKQIFTSAEATHPFTLSKSGSPIIEVFINGITHHFWLDTGAGLTVLSSSVASSAGILGIDSLSTDVETSTPVKIKGIPALLPALQMGGLILNSHPCLILKDSDLEFKNPNGSLMFKIDGIIGWPVLKNLNLLIDYQNLKITISKPLTETKKEDPELIWIGYPVVKLMGHDGQLLWFGLDTGAGTTSIRNSYLSRYPEFKSSEKERTIGGAGGFRTIKVKSVNDVIIYSSVKRLSFPQLSTSFAEPADFILLDGMLGSDVFRQNKVRLNFPEGVFEILP
ncbi:MAG: aspartyl protease family protein [Bacteroidetes bacterium]|nr:aspartyl protease family protein [Bacteroidota bacterium]